jgi:8-oxo-dGTP pyrophosphatase MutT (NUDIX family)/phosphohistidine phosphatase SixA
MGSPGEEEAVLDLTAEVRAAGGILRRVVDGEVQTVLVHRPRYDDWSFPKGKVEDGESLPEAAVREVREETGLEARIGAGLPSSSYRDGQGRSKVVSYWFMEPVSGSDLRPTGEVDEARWLALPDARAALTHERDRELLDVAAAADASVYLVRHAKAGDRDAWSGVDRLRPLSKSGRRQAKGLVRTLADRSIGHIASSPALRCLDTVRPLAKQRGQQIDVREELFEGAPLDGMLAIVDDAGSAGTVVCAHGDLIPEAIEYYEARGATVGAERGWKKGSVWVLEREAGLIVRATYVPPSEGEPKRAARRASPVPSGPSA